MSETSDMGSHLIATDKQHLTVTKGDTSTQINSSIFQSGLKSSFFDFSLSHPSAQLSRLETTEIDRQNINIKVEYGESIELYTRQLEEIYITENCLAKHKITPTLRARMIDWMIEVLTNFKCDDQTFFLAASLLDRYLKTHSKAQEVADLHMMGVTCMFIASKYEDVQPLKMKMVFEKIAHKKLSIDKIKSMELEILKTIHYKIPAPSVLDFLKVYMKEVLDIGHLGNTSLTKEDKDAVPTSSDCDAG